VGVVSTQTPKQPSSFDCVRLLSLLFVICRLGVYVKGSLCCIVDVKAPSCIQHAYHLCLAWCSLPLPRPFIKHEKAQEKFSLLAVLLMQKTSSDMLIHPQITTGAAFPTASRMSCIFATTLLVSAAATHMVADLRLSGI